MNIILMGMKHCGKTTVGRRLAASLQLPFYDLDEVIRSGRGAGGTNAIEVLFKRKGPADFYRLEADAFFSVCGDSRPNGLVLALGGRTPLNPWLGASLEQCGFLIYINTPFEIIRDRIMTEGKSALLGGGDPEATLREVYDERHPVYVRLARLVVDGAGAADAVADRIRQGIEELRDGGK
jgi:shikimate kinase